jgi:PAS domain-containing protein
MKDTPWTAEEWFRAAADASLDALFIAKGVRDEAGHLVDFECIDINGPALALLGMAREKVIGQKLWGLLPINRERFFDKYAQVVATGSPLEEEFPIDTPEPTAKWLRHQVVRVGDGIAISARDVTRWKESGARLKESEERLRLATEAAHMGAWTWDPKVDRFSFSEGMGPVFGLPRGEGFHTPAELITAVYPADRDIIARALMEGREKGTPVRVEVRTI